MPSFGFKSNERLLTVDYKLQVILTEAIKYTDFSILCGHRGEDEQNRLQNEGRSQLTYPFSNHNRLPSKAVDIAPYPIDWDDINRFKELALIMFKVAQEKNIQIRWGGFWDSLKDYPHFEVD